MEMKIVLTDKEVAQAIAVGLRATGLKPKRCQFKVADDGSLTCEVTIDSKPMTDAETAAAVAEAKGRAGEPCGR